MNITPIKNINSFFFISHDRDNTRISFKGGNINENVFLNEERDSYLKKIFDTTDSESSGIQFFNNFIAENRINNSLKEKKSFDYENAIRNIKNQNSFDEEWVRNNIFIFEKLYDINLPEGVDYNLLSMYKKDLNRDKIPVLLKLEKEYLKEKLGFLHNNIAQIKEWNDKNINDLNISVIKKEPIPGICVLSKSIENSDKPSFNSLHNKTNAKIFEFNNINEFEFENNLNQIIQKARNSSSSDKDKKTLKLILVDNLYKYINKNPRNLDYLKSQLESLKQERANFGTAIAILDFEGFDSSALSPKIKHVLKNIPFYDEQKELITDKFITPYLNNDTAKVQFPVLFIDGNSKKDIVSVINAYKEDFALPLLTIKQDTNINDFIENINNKINDSKLSHNKKPVIFIPGLYKYTAFNKENLNFINNIIKEQKAIFVISSDYPEKLENIIKQGNCLNITLNQPDKPQFVNALKQYIDRADDCINEMINKGANIPALNIDINCETIIKNLININSSVGFSDLNEIVENAKKNYLKNPQMPFSKYLIKAAEPYMED